MTDVGRHYPSPVPSLPEESNDAYTNRLLGMRFGFERPYDHPRNRQCSIGYHRECSRWRTGGDDCQCPCHSDAAPKVVRLTRARAEAADWLIRSYDLPKATGLRVIGLAVTAIAEGRAPTLAALNEVISAAYDWPQTEGFIATIVLAMGKTGAEGPPAFGPLLAEVYAKWPETRR